MVQSKVATYRTCGKVRKKQRVVRKNSQGTTAAVPLNRNNFDAVAVSIVSVDQADQCNVCLCVCFSSLRIKHTSKAPELGEA